MYTIGQVAKQVNMPVSTLRYYDNEGLFPHLVRCSGIRKFSDNEIEALHIIECLKKSGLEIREIKKFMELCAQGSSTYPQRHALFLRQKAAVEEKCGSWKKHWTCFASNAGITNRPCRTETKNAFKKCCRITCQKIFSSYMTTRMRNNSKSPSM